MAISTKERQTPIVTDYQAVILDMDGVVTQTARLHARAWKQMFDDFLAQQSAGDTGPFGIEDDYSEYLDGVPRYEGVRNFLRSRKIELPYGSPEDPPERETVCGLGNRKNEIFHELLKTEGVEVYAPTVQAIKEWKAAGLKVAVISSSKNCKPVLNAAGLVDLFDAIVDGIEAEQAGLAPKPAPDIFVEAARRLSVKPGKSVVVEDSLAGVEAGHKGGFGLVIGLDRQHHADELRGRGADMVLNSLGSLTSARQSVGEGERTRETRRSEDLPSALEELDTILARLCDRHVGFFLDYDGTLTPIVENPDDALLSDRMREVLDDISTDRLVAIVSGRDLKTVQERVGLDSVYYAGSHGFDIAGPGDFRMEHEAGKKSLAALDAIEERLKSPVADVEGARLERKRFSLAVHYRQVAEADVERVKTIVDEALADTQGLRKGGGKKVIEIGPDVAWNKGYAVNYLIQALDGDDPDFVPVYIGDDLTDENAFRALSGTGVSVLVGDHGAPTAAEYHLDSVEEVKVFLERLVEALRCEENGEQWMLSYETYSPDSQPLREALCTLGNGYFATRGAFEEMAAGGHHYPGTYLAGGYNRADTEIAGRIVENEDLVNWPNWLSLSLRIEQGSWFDLDELEVLEFHQELDVRRGVLTRRVKVRDLHERETTLFAQRIVHMGKPHLAAIHWTVVPENWSGVVTVRSALDGRVVNAGVARYRELEGRHLEPIETGKIGEDGIYLKVRTRQAERIMAQAARTDVASESAPVAASRRTIEEPGYVAQEIDFRMEKLHRYTVTKVVSLYTSRDAAISDTLSEARQAVLDAPEFEDLADSHEQAWSRLWRRCDLRLAGDERAQLVLRLHIFHLLQTTSLNTTDLDVGVPSRGWHGEAYRGHVFWDELFIFPYLNLRIPELTRSLLMYRYRRLPEARRHAREAEFEGALFPWQSGSNGREESQVIHLNPESGRWIPDNTHLQRHVNAAIAFNVWQYYEATEDIEFLFFYGAEILLEVARFWASIAKFNADRNRYEIHGIVGPDEYHTAYPNSDAPGLNNNAYTNVMAAWSVRAALRALDQLPEEYRAELVSKLDVTHDEILRWQEVSNRMYVPFDGDGLILQFEGYDKLEELDWEAYKKKYDDIQRLDRILEAEDDTPNRYKVSKQADVLMLFYLFSAEELQNLFEHMGYPFDPEWIPANIDYYTQRTSYGSSLSRLVFSWVSARADRERAWKLFQEALESDMSDVQGGTTPEGIHLGAMAGTVDIIQRCFTGVEVREDILWLNPRLPDELATLRLRLRYRRHWIAVHITHHTIELSLQQAEDGCRQIRVGLCDEILELEAGAVVTRSLPLPC